VATGGYALRSYERFSRLKPDAGGRLRLAHPRLVPRYRLNVGTIVEGPLLKVRLVGRGSVRRPGTRQSLTGGRVLGEVDEYFASEMVPGDTFVFGGEVVRLEGIRELNVYVSRASASDPKIPSYPGGKFPLSTHLAQRVRTLLAERESWARLPAPVSEWLGLQQERSVVPRANEVLIETFQRANRHFLVAYPFEGRLAHQTLGMLLTRRLDRAKAAPTGFVASDYALAVWGLGDLSHMIADGTLDLGRLFDEDMLGDDLEAWLAESGLMRRTFRASSRSPPISSTRCCGATSRAMCCSRPPTRTPPPAFSMSRVCRTSCAASKVESGILRCLTSRRWRSRSCSTSARSR
jgi:ATP-dependent Lhr-like helicase